MILRGNCLDTLKTLPDNSVDSIVTDPPYELGFMGKSWDNSGIAYNQDLWRECLRVLKPGGHLLAFSGSRTYHRMTVAIEDAGFEIRDQIMWLYGSGFPKSLDVSKAIDKAAGVVGEVIGERTFGKTSTGQGSGWNTNAVAATGRQDITAPATPEAQRWQGWGTALKPAHEPICVARKPVIGTVANNVLTYGTGALNINVSRVPSDDGFEKAWDKPISTNISAKNGKYISEGVQHTVDLSSNRPEGGRWPANVIHDGSDEVVAGFPESKTGAVKPYNTKSQGYGGGWGSFRDFSQEASEGSAARFFYCAKASKSERNAGLEGLPELPKNERKEGGKSVLEIPGKSNQNPHPTVKPIALMRYLVKLVTPPGGTVLDPFLGSGSTAVAAVLEGFNWIGCEMTEDYFPIIEARVKWAEEQPRGSLPQVRRETMTPEATPNL